MLSTIEDGRISVSPYNTAWMALIKNTDDRDLPQFPSSVTWIVHHQLPDGSWGDQNYFNVYDRLVNTIACVIALKSWNVHADKIEKGLRFFSSINIYVYPTKISSSLKWKLELHIYIIYYVVFKTTPFFSRLNDVILHVDFTCIVEISYVKQNVWDLKMQTKLTWPVGLKSYFPSFLEEHKKSEYMTIFMIFQSWTRFIL